MLLRHNVKAVKGNGEWGAVWEEWAEKSIETGTHRLREWEEMFSFRMAGPGVGKQQKIKSCEDKKARSSKAHIPC